MPAKRLSLKLRRRRSSDHPTDGGGLFRVGAGGTQRNSSTGGHGTNPKEANCEQYNYGECGPAQLRNKPGTSPQECKFTVTNAAPAAAPAATKSTASASACEDPPIPSEITVRLSGDEGGTSTKHEFCGSAKLTINADCKNSIEGGAGDNASSSSSSKSSSSSSSQSPAPSGRRRRSRPVGPPPPSPPRAPPPPPSHRRTTSASSSACSARPGRRRRRHRATGRPGRRSTPPPPPLPPEDPCTPNWEAPWAPPPPPPSPAPPSEGSLPRVPFLYTPVYTYYVVCAHHPFHPARVVPRRRGLRCCPVGTTRARPTPQRRSTYTCIDRAAKLMIKKTKSHRTDGTALAGSIHASGAMQAALCGWP